MNSKAIFNGFADEIMKIGSSSVSPTEGASLGSLLGAVYKGVQAKKHRLAHGVGGGLLGGLLGAIAVSDIPRRGIVNISDALRKMAK